MRRGRPKRCAATSSRRRNGWDAEATDERRIRAGRHRVSIFPWKRQKSGPAEALAAEIKRIAATNHHTANATGAIARAISGADESACREALQILLSDPEALF